MNLASKLNIDLTKTFPHLAQAPIIEAVIDIRARAEAPWEELAVLERLKVGLPGYPDIQSGHAFRQEVRVGIGQPVEQAVHDLGWRGLRAMSADKLYIAQFNRDGFVFSRLQPYEDWQRFHEEALRLWQLYLELAHPMEIHRLGLRFINRIEFSHHELRKELRIEEYLHVSPQTPRDLDIPFRGFFHRDELEVPGYSYAINVVRTVQPLQVQAAEGIGLILDIDVFTTQPFDLQRGSFEQQLLEMRWLKNKVFFGSLTQKGLERFQ